MRDYDDDILQHFLESLNATHPIKSATDKRHPSTIMHTITFVSDRLVSDLQRLSVGENKTFTINYSTIFNNIPTNLWYGFILGLFDGDGNIDVPADGTISRSHVRLSGPMQQLMEIQAVFTNLSIKLSLIQDKRNYTKPFGSLECSNTSSKYCLLKFLYQNSTLRCLSRKRSTALELIQRIEKNVTNRSENKKAIAQWQLIGRSEWHE